MYSLQFDVIKFASDLRRLVVFSGYLCFINIYNSPLQYNWYSVESGVKHHNPKLKSYTLLHSYKWAKKFLIRQSSRLATCGRCFYLLSNYTDGNLAWRLAILNYSMLFFVFDANWKYGTKMPRYMVWLEKYIFLTNISVTAYQTRQISAGAWVRQQFLVVSMLLIFLVFFVVFFVLFVFVLCLVYPVLPVSLDCQFLIVPLVFPTVYLSKKYWYMWAS